MVYVFCSVADQEVIHIQSTVCSTVNVFHNIINFYIEQHDRQYPFLFFFRENLSHSYSKSSTLKEVFRSLTMPYFQVVSYAFSRLKKKTATRCSFLIEASLINVSNWIRWSIGLLWLLKPDWYLVINLFISKYRSIWHLSFSPLFCIHNC